MSFISAAIYGECGGNYAGVRGHLASPGFPFKDYPADQDCEWVIEVPTNLFVEVSKSGDAHTFCNENKRKSGRSKLPVIDLWFLTLCFTKSMKLEYNMKYSV